VFEVPDTSDEQGVERHRARYLEMQARAASRTIVRQAPRPASAVQTTVAREVIPPGWYWTARLRIGQRLRIANSTGRACVALQAWNAVDPSERLNVGDTAKLQWTTRVSTGGLLFSDMGRVLAAVVDDKADGQHDLLTGPSDESSNRERYGRSGFRDSHGNFLLAAAKLGLSRRDVHPCLNLFSAVRTNALGALEWAGSSRAGAVVEMRAELPLLIALSNCPHPLDPSPNYDPGHVEVAIVAADTVPADDFCRTSSEEAERAFANTAAWIAANGGPVQ
jgi:urea carboxylase-associated protein 2